MFLSLTLLSNGDERVLGPVVINFSQVQKFLPFGDNTIIFFDRDTTTIVKESFYYIQEKIKNENI